MENNSHQGTSEFYFFAGCLLNVQLLGCRI